jgi:hypothetical protein
MFKSVFVLIATVLSLQAQAQSIRLGQPSYGGTGCPAGSASVTVSPDQSAITILFDQFIAEAGQATGRRFDRKSCNLTIPVHVPNGYSVSIFKVDYRGFNLIPRGGMNRFDAEYFWAGSRGPRLTRVFYGPINDSFTLTDELIARTEVWTPCGQSVNLRVNASMSANSNTMLDQTVGMVDSADIDSGLIYHIRYRRCY